MGTGLHETTQAGLGTLTREARPPTGQRSPAGTPLQQPRAHREPCGLLSDYLSAETELSTREQRSFCKTRAFVIREMYSATEAPFQQYKLDTAIPFMKILIKPETVGSRFFPLLYLLRLCLLFITIRTPGKYCPGFAAASVAE